MRCRLHLVELADPIGLPLEVAVELREPAAPGAHVGFELTLLLLVEVERELLADPPLVLRQFLAHALALALEGLAQVASPRARRARGACSIGAAPPTPRRAARAAAAAPRCRARAAARSLRRIGFAGLRGRHPRRASCSSRSSVFASASRA